MLAGNKVVDHPRLERTGTEQGNQRDQIVKMIRLHAFDEITHAARLELEHCPRLACPQQFERFRILHRDFSDFDVGVGVARICDLHRPIDNRQCLESEEIEFDQTGRFDIILVELRYRIRAAFLAVQWRKVCQFVRSNYYSARVFAGVAYESLERFRQIDNPPDVFVFLVHLRELVFLIQRLVERYADLERNLLCDAIDKSIRLSEHPACITNDRFGSHRAIGNDLRNPVPAIHVRNVVDDAVATLHTEIDVKVGHRHALGIQEALEQQIVLQRIDVGDAQHIGNQ